MIVKQVPGEPALRGKGFCRLHPVAAYFLLTFGISWGAAFSLVAPQLLRGQPIQKFNGLMMFPLMLLGPVLSGCFMTWQTGRGAGLRSLFQRMVRLWFAPRWLAALLIPATLILVALTCLATAVGPVFRPNFFPLGFVFGLCAGLVEEVGWTGFAFPALGHKRSAFAAAIALGLFWSLWHIPALDYLGASTPHGSWWLAYFMAFTAAMTAVRVLICWVYLNTGSLLMAQLFHAASTGSLVIFSPPRASAAQEALWYGIYAMLLWFTVAAVRLYAGSGLVGRP